MEKIGSLYLAVNLCLLLCLSLAGCGQAAGTKADGGAGAQYVYRADACPAEGMDGYAVGAVGDGDRLCAGMFAVNQESKAVEKWISCYDIETGETRETRLDGAERTLPMQFAVLEDGGFWCVLYNVDAGRLAEVSINRYDADGKVIASDDVTEILNQDGWRGIYHGDNTQIDRDGNLYLGFSDGEDTGNYMVAGISPKGQLLFCTGMAGNVDRMLLADDGKLYAAVRRGEKKQEIVALDIVSGEAETLIKDLPWDGVRTVLGMGIDGDRLYYNAAGDFYEYALGDRQSTKLFSLEEVQLSEEEIVGMVQTDRNHFYFLANMADGTGKISGEWICIRRVHTDHAEPVSDKEVLTLAVFAEDSVIRQAVTYFNRQSDTVRIELQVYGGLGGEDGRNRLQADIAAGRTPDMIDLGGVDAMVYIRQGLLTDLAPFLEQDQELSESDFLENVIYTYRDGDGLYAIPTIFWISSMMGKSSWLDGRTGWSLEEFMDYVEGLPDPKAAMAGVSRTEMFDRLMVQYAEQYIDWESGTCSFDSEEFLELLRFVNRFPDKVEAEGEEQMVEKLRSGEVLLYPTVMNCAAVFQCNQALFDEEVTYIGFPSEAGSGTKLMVFGNAFGISQSCANKEAAWEFLKTLYTGDGNTVDGFPVYKESLEKAFAFAAAGSYHVDESGARIETPKYEIPYGSLTLEIYAAKEEEIRQLRKLIETAEPADIRTPGIYAILQEEAAAFFGGQMSAEGAAEVMQSRTALYISERSGF